MSANPKDAAFQLTAAGRHRPFFVTVIAVLLGAGTVAVIAEGIMLSLRPEVGASSSQQTLLATVVVAALGIVLARGLWRLQNWARTAVILLLVVIGLYYGLTVVFDAAAEIFGGEQVVPVVTILSITFRALLKLVATGFIPVAMIYGLSRLGADFYESPGQRAFMDRGIRYILLVTALSSIFIVFLIIVFTVLESREAIEKIGLRTMLLGTVWRPGSIIGTEEAQFGLIPMIIGSILATFGAVVLGVPLSIGTAILLAEVSPPSVREIVRPAV
jgi:hypothetical protein